MNATVRARIDEKLKEEAAAILEAQGLTISAAFRLLLLRVTADRQLPFEPWIPNKATIAAVKEARQGGLRSVKTTTELFAELNDERAPIHKGVQKGLQTRKARRARAAT